MKRPTADIAARKKAEAALRESGERIRLLLNSTTDGIFGIDLESKCIFANSACVRLLGHESNGGLMGRDMHMLTHHTRPDGTEYPEHQCRITNTLRAGRTVTVDDEVFWRADGTSFPVEYRVAPIRQEGRTVGGVVSFVDITERRNTELQLRQAQKLESIGQLAAGIAHEINTPTQFVNDNTRFLQEAFADYGRLLAAHDRLTDAAAGGSVPEARVDEVRALAEEIDLDYLKGEIPQAVEQSLEGLERIARIVQATKEFSHPGTKEKTATDLNRMIETTIDVSRNEWKYSAELIAELDPELPQVPVMGGEFNQVILNLIVNAAHAITDAVGESGEMGEIRIATRQEGKWAEITISDSGTGIPEAIQRRIFDPFFTTKEVGKGSGQGLAIAWSVIVDKHGGTIEVESEEGNGATFTICLPINRYTAL